MAADEKLTLSKIGNATKKSRLACQIPVNEKLNNIVFKLMFMFNFCVTFLY
nr:hypothetical protein [uncultured bacterium]